MRPITYNLQIEPSGALYRGLIDFAVSCCPLVLLVVRPEIELTDGGQRLLASMKPFEVDQVKLSSWPGTELFNAEANIFCYRLEERSARLLKTATDRLYGWCHPDLPEDLCFLREDRQPWLVTIAHENDGFLLLTDWEEQRLLRTLPNLKLKSSKVF